MSIDQDVRYFGTAIPLPGNDIDTDRILPARYLKSITFEALGDHVLEDERRAHPDHAFNQINFRGASILVVERNFGCGSSREHAPRALNEWGIKCIVGRSFAEIFLGNCVSIGVPCLSPQGESDVQWLQDRIAAHPSQPISISLRDMNASFLDRTIPLTMPAGARSQFLDGTWDVTATLLQAGDHIEMTANRLPYIRNWTE